MIRYCLVGVCLAASFVLAGCGDKSDDPATRQKKNLKSQTPEVRAKAAEELGNAGPADLVSAVPALLTALTDERPEVRQAAAVSLGQVPPAQHAKVVPALTDSLNDTNSNVRHKAALALSKIGPDAVPAKNKFIEMLRSGDSQDAWWACEALGRMGPEASDAVSALMIQLDSPLRENRARAAWTLGRIGPSAAAAAGKLAQLTGDPEMCVRVSAENALRMIRGQGQ